MPRMFWSTAMELGLIIGCFATGIGAGELREPFGTAITYQGQLEDGSAPANGTYDLRFRLYDSAIGDDQVGSTVISEDVAVTDGRFTVQLDFGDVWDGSALWLHIGVRPGDSSGDFTPLSPLQPLSAAPTALSLRPGAHVGADLDGEAVLEITNAAATGESTGVLGVSHSTDGRGVFGDAEAESGITYGVYGRSSSPSGLGVHGLAQAPDGPTVGVYGVSLSNEGRGVWGEAIAHGGTTFGVYGRSYSDDGCGVYGNSTSTSGTNYGVYGKSQSTGGRGVYGIVTAETGYTRGVYGRCDSTQGRGVYGWAKAGSGTNYGVYGNTSSPDGYAGYFLDRVHVSGDLSASGTKAFKIDHPLAPATQYLYHFALEAPEVQNVYNGVVQLDEDGAATVALPAYFSALNTGVFRYQLTAIGAAMPNLHVAKRIETDTFSIAGGEPGHEVSWEVNAVRNDPYVRDHRLATEAAKPAAERGTYLYPEGYGQPETLARDYEPHDEAP